MLADHKNRALHREEEADPSATKKARLRDDEFVALRSRTCSGVSPLYAAAFGGPVRKALQLVAVFPCQLKKF